ncbi:MAG TPA: response regulator [Polaromonas sp.]|uniref:response regulator n=1 Tax=Polaromonas sp. TaxID=1869339 RepID=UPI002D5A2FBA|nr:response regulator [Polaromonas sp.]HYW57329.1 response regulator [Polaromonas sp.]
MKKVSVKFYGFNETELRSLETVFRLSESRDTVYSAWTPESTDEPDILLIEGDSWEAVLELANPVHDGLKLIWVGVDAPAHAWRVFPAPVKWSAVIESMDEEFSPPPQASMDDAPIDLDLLHEEDMRVQFDEEDNTAPSELEPELPPEPERRVLVVDQNREDRLYLRAKLATAGLFEIDEASSGAEALEFLRRRHYHLITVDLELGDMDSWQLMQTIERTRPVIAHVWVTGTKLAWYQGWRAWFAGAEASLKKPLLPARLNELLQKV